MIKWEEKKITEGDGGSLNWVISPANLRGQGISETQQDLLSKWMW